MRWIKSILVVLFALFWIGTTSHCTLEAVPGLEFLSCAGEEAAAEDSHCEDDGCEEVENGLYFHQQINPVAAHVLAILPFDLFAPLEDFKSDAVKPGTILDSFPELPPSWQFVYRTALPARAPSFVS